MDFDTLEQYKDGNRLMVRFSCFRCSKPSVRRAYEVKKSLKLGTKNLFCSRLCSAKAANSIGYPAPEEFIVEENGKKRTWVRIKCRECRVEFERLRSEVRKSEKRGLKLFCSLKCTAKYNHLRGNYKNRPPEHRNSYWTPFYVVLKSVHRAMKQDTRKVGDVTATALEALWREQGGKCALSGIDLYLPSETNDWSKKPTRMSVDRIDSSKGYEVGNIQLITCMANYCKHTWSNKDVIEFAEAVTKFQNRP